jgi:hypothetical protein
LAGEGEEYEVEDIRNYARIDGQSYYSIKWSSGKGMSQKIPGKPSRT